MGNAFGSFSSCAHCSGAMLAANIVECRVTSWHVEKGFWQITT